MKATFKEEVKHHSQDYVKLYVESVCENRAKVIAKREFAKLKYSGNKTKKKLQANVLKILYNSCIYEPLKVNVIYNDSN